MKIIINADDFGKSHQVNEAIQEQISSGNITSTTIMANADGFDEAISIALQNPQVSYGVHLSLDEYRPMTNIDVFRKYGIVDDRGYFVKGAILRLKINEELRASIEQEWSVQIEKIKNKGIKISHVDSHHHVHTIPSLLETLVCVLNKYCITKVRKCDYMSKKRILGGYKHFPDGIFLKEVAYLILKFRKQIECSKWNAESGTHFSMTDEFTSVASFIRNQSYYTQQAENLFIVELECHPGHPKYNKETLALSTLGKFEKITYNEL